MRLVIHILTGAVCLLAASLSVPSASAANIRADRECTQQACTIWFSGTINKAADDDLRSILQRFPSARLRMMINSDGGDVTAAMRLGRQLRGFDTTAVVPLGARCASACVLMFVGATFRVSEGDIGIHRAYLSVPPRNVTRDEVRELFRRSDAEVRAYLREMDIPEALADAMAAVSPEHVRWLDAFELEQLRVTGWDAASAEAQKLNEARRLGINRQEYMRRERRLTICLNEMHRADACRAEVMAGRR